MSIASSTITNNSATAGRGVYSLANVVGLSPELQVYNTIVGQADSTSTTTELVATFELGGTVNVSGGHNLIFKHLLPSAMPGFATENIIPPLGPLAANDGPMLTHAILPGGESHPLIDKGDPSIAVGQPGVPAHDQRGTPFGRVYDGDGVAGGRIDIGAYEWQTAATGQELPGDYNGDRKVNAADYTVWRNTLGTPVAKYEGADGDGSNWIDMPDYEIWKQHYGDSLPPEEGAGAVARAVAAGGATSGVGNIAAAKQIAASSRAAEEIADPAGRGLRGRANLVFRPEIAIILARPTAWSARSGAAATDSAAGRLELLAGAAFSAHRASDLEGEAFSVLGQASEARREAEDDRAPSWEREGIDLALVDAVLGAWSRRR
jgi:hypothetical protein